MRTYRYNASKLVALVATMFLSVITYLGAAPSAELWDRWLARNDNSNMTVDHSDLETILDAYRVVDPADGIAKIRYSDVSPADYQLLSTYVDALQSVDVDNLSADQQFAFWVNLYNAATLQLILDNYPLESIRDISRPWDQKFLEVAGEPISLNDIEHRILRPIWEDYRIHFVVNCASIGCPDIPAQPLDAESDLEQQLNSAANAYLQHPRGLRRDGRSIILSSIFNWYSSDFGNGKEEVLETLSAHVDIASLLADMGRTKDNVNLRYEYDWSLNEAP